MSITNVCIPSSHIDTDMAARIKSLFIRGWNEIPEIMGSSVIALIGLGFGIAALSRDDSVQEQSRYKRVFTIMRPDDPRTRFVRPE